VNESSGESGGLTSGDPLAGADAASGRRAEGRLRPDDEPAPARSDARTESAEPGSPGPAPSEARPESAEPGSPGPAPSEARPEFAEPGSPGRAPSDARPEFAEPRSPAADYVGGPTSAPPPAPFGAFAESLGTPPDRASAHRLAGWWSRVGAALLDGLVVGVGGLVLLAIVGAVFSVGFFASDTAGIVSVVIGLMLAFSAFAVIALLYAPFMMARTDGQTLGKMAMGIRVVRVNGEPMTFGSAMLREVAVKWLLFGVVGSSTTFGLAWLVDVLWPLWDDENRALHDLIAGTRVVKT
jgi:uncharacterized RDD family membrane protein YckC